MITIKCTMREKDAMIDSWADSETCPFIRGICSAAACDCEQCVLTNINWIITEEDKDEED